jgi:predicted nucleic acid-binding protein
MNSMSARQFVDTNISMYAHDASAGEKQRQAEALVEGLWRDIPSNSNPRATSLWTT